MSGLDLYRYHSKPDLLIGIESYIAGLGAIKQGQFLENGMYRTHPEKFEKFTKTVADAFDQYDSGNVYPLLLIADYCREIPGVAEKFKDRIKKIKLSEIESNLQCRDLMKLFGVPVEWYADTEQMYEMIQTRDRLHSMISKKYFNDIQRAVQIIWSKRTFSIFDITGYIKDSPEMKQYITPEMKSQITDAFDKAMLREVGLDI
jgi:hypothetical protein